jgi:hypothetical protein
VDNFQSSIEETSFEVMDLLRHSGTGTGQPMVMEKAE